MERIPDLRFLVNPAAGGGRSRRLLERVHRAGRAAGAAVVESVSGEDLRRLARRAVADGVRRVVAVGGDGTLHLVIQELAGSATELAIIPCGRGDDLAVSLGVPRRPDAALRLAVEGSARSFDLGRADDHWFGLYGGLGFDSAVTATANRQARSIPAALTYVVATVRTLAGFRPPAARVEHDQGVWEGRIMFATVCNAPRFGGGMLIAPRARMDDGELDLVIVREIGKARLMRVFPLVFSGRHVRHPAVSIVRTRRAVIEVDPPALLASDGEVLGSSGRTEFRVEPAALRAVTLEDSDVELDSLRQR